MRYKSSKQFGLNANVFMFAEDIWHTIMPIGSEARRTLNFSVKIQASPNHETRATAILKSLAEKDGDCRSNLEELLSDSVQWLAQQLAWNGCAVHEIIRDKENDGVYQLHNLTSQRLFRDFGKYKQKIPKADRKLWNITMPKELGGCRGYRAILKDLARFSNLGPSFLMDEPRKQAPPAYYDLQCYVRETKFFVAKITARWGWNRRDSTLQNSTGFYWVYKSLTLKWAQACLREHIVNELNQLFRRLDIEVEIVVKGLPTAQDILKIRQQMCEGKIYFGDALDKCSV